MNDRRIGRVPRRQHWWLLTGAAVVSSLVVAACSTTVEPSAGTLPATGTAPAAVAIAWGPCDATSTDPGATEADPPGTYECAAFPVPIDWEDPGGDTVDLALKRRLADDPDQRIGSLFINPGGPGVSGVARVGQFVDKLGPDVAARFDVVGFDPRGVQGSDQLACATGIVDFLADDLTGSQPADGLAAAATAWADQCAASPLLAHVGTNQVVRDLDALRAAVGDDQLTFIGVSYGTEIGAVYADRYPDKVRAIIIDGVVDISQSGEASIDGQAGAWRQALDNFFTWCAGQPSTCPIAADPEGGFDAVLAALRAQPATVDVDGRTVVVSPTIVELLTIVLAYDPAAYGQIASLLTAAQAGDLTQFAQLAVAVAPALGPAVYVYCQDFGFPSGDAYQAYVERLEAAYGSPGALDGNINRPCGHWPVPIDPVPADYSYTGAAPIMVWGTTNDTSTPYVNSVHAVEQLGNAQLVTLEADKHTAYGTNQCVEDIQAAYLIDLTMPPEGTRC